MQIITYSSVIFANENLCANVLVIVRMNCEGGKVFLKLGIVQKKTNLSSAELLLRIGL